MENLAPDRLTFLAEKFDVFDPKETKEKLEALVAEGYEVKALSASKGPETWAFLKSKVNEKERVLTSVSINLDIFSDIIAADPTPNHICVQWMLNVFTRFMKLEDKKSWAAALRFVEEDLPQAREYLELFEQHKRKQKFKKLVASGYLQYMTDPTNINQYKSLSQLFDAVDPFITKDGSAMEQLLEKYVTSGQALIPVRDRKFTLYIPKTRDASVVFDKFASWCTAKVGNGNFASYKSSRKPDGKESELYIIINNKFFLKGPDDTVEDDDIYQIHFESNQIKNRKNGQDKDIFDTVINQSEALSGYFYKELMAMAKLCKSGLDDNKYLDYLLDFGFAESIFELMEEATPSIKVMQRKINALPDVSRFKEVDEFIITNAHMKELHPSVGSLQKLEKLVLTDNYLKTIPKEIGNLSQLHFLNLKGNKLTDIPTELKYLDPSNGGELWFIAVREEDIGEKNYKKLKELLPTVDFIQTN